MPTVTVDDIQIYYECTGVGPPVLLIHGLGSSTRDWAAQVAALAPTFQIITADLRGHGRSAKPRERYRMARFAADMAGLLRALDAAPAHVVGLSLGGMVAFELALTVPTLVRSLVIINSGPEVPVPTRRERLRLIGVYLWRVAVVRLAGMRRMGATLARHLLPEPEQAALRQTFIDRWAENDPRAYLAALRAIGGWNVTARLPALHCPTLVVAAEEDYTSVIFKQDYTARIPQADLVVIPGSRHLTPLDRPNELNAALLSFLQKVG
ncbi:MAG: alpha/beta fold hydrolase [Chloroflexaceae bacterium]